MGMVERGGSAVGQNTYAIDAKKSKVVEQISRTGSMSARWTRRTEKLTQKRVGHRGESLAGQTCSP